MTASHKKKSASNNAIAYYDHIASRYDSIQEELPINKIVREKVKERFLWRVKEKTILDFGGGTGGDLEWLVSNGFRVYFCEPSEKMRAQAILLKEKKLKSSEVIFLQQEETDFRKWKSINPFPEQVDAVLANFAVFNNIEDLPLLFEILARQLKPEGVTMATMLRSGFLKFNRKGFLKSVMLRIKKEPIRLPGKESREGFTYVYPVSQIQKAARPFFNITVVEKLTHSDFIFLEFKKVDSFSV
jgi:SAM-dependent methyltransferase